MQASAAEIATATAGGPARARRSERPEAARLGQRRALGVLVVAGVMLLHASAEWAAGRQTASIVARLTFLAFELAVLMAALSAASSWAMRRRLTAGQALLAGVVVATIVGCSFGPLYAELTLHVPALRSRFPDGIGLLRSTLFGTLYAQLYAGLWALAFVYPRAVDRARVRELEDKHLRSEAELARLRAHLEPHFMLNTLNAIAGLVTEEPKEARRLLVCLGDLLRDAVRETSEMQSFGDQIAWLRRYAEILETRHRGALRFRWEIDAKVTDRLLPRLLLQPLVENAVKHGALRRREPPGEVLVRGELSGDALVCTVADDGPGMAAHDERFGLHAVRRRLELEAPGAKLRVETEPGRTAWILELPRGPEDRA